MARCLCLCLFQPVQATETSLLLAIAWVPQADGLWRGTHGPVRETTAEICASRRQPAKPRSLGAMQRHPTSVQVRSR